jgi:hypothetical protein
MRMRRRLLLLLALAVGAGASSALAQDVAPAERYNVRLEYLFWSPQPSGQLQKGFSEEEGTLVDIEDDLAMAESAMNPVRGTLRFGAGVKLRGSWSRLDFEGDTLAERFLSYGNVVVAPGQRVASELSGNYFTAEIAWDFLERPGGFLGLLAGVKYFDVDVLLLNASTSERVVETERLPIPVIGLAGRAYFGRWFSVEGELSGLPAGNRGHVYEVMVAGRAHASRRIALTLGWRKLAIEGRDDRDFFKLDLGTWTIGAELSL